MNSFSSPEVIQCSRRVLIGFALFIVTLTTGCKFTVNSVLDALDVNPGDGLCETAAGACTLRAAVMEVNASRGLRAFLASPGRPFIIELPKGTYLLDLPTSSGGGRLTIRQFVNIQGDGASTTIIDGKLVDIAIYVESGTAAINNLTVQGSNGQTSAGGAIWVNTSAELNNLILQNGRADTGGGGLYVASGGKVTIRRSAIINNFAVGAFGGGIWNKGELRVYDSSIIKNESNRAGGIHNDGQMNLRNTTISGNKVHSTSGAGTGGIVQNGFAVLNNVTVTDNTGVTNDRAGGILTVAGKTTVLKNSIIAGNHGGTGADDCAGALTLDSKYNLIGDPNGCVITLYLNTYAGYNGTAQCLMKWDAVTCLDPVNAQLGPLANNGGPTQSHLPIAGSKALETGYPFAPGGPAADACEGRDQRGVPRPQGGGKCDMGAVEVTSANVFVTGFVLVDAATDTDIGPLLHGDTLFLDELPAQLSVRAAVTGSPGSVVFDFDNTVFFQVENLAPYALAGDNSAGDYNPATLGEGVHTITATPFAGAGGAGTAGGSHTVTFTVQKPIRLS